MYIVYLPHPPAPPPLKRIVTKYNSVAEILNIENSICTAKELE